MYSQNQLDSCCEIFPAQGQEPTAHIAANSAKHLQLNLILTTVLEVWEMTSSQFKYSPKARHLVG